jgi:hypothetical protein
VEQLQYDTHTSTNRYPYLFKHLASYAHASSPDLKILSFGCSLGDELMDLYALFPRARLYGCDINPAVLAQARSRCGSFAEVFFSSEAEIAARGPFHLVLCLSVLCIHGQNAAQIGELLPFSKFEDILLRIAGQCTPDGAIAVFNASYFPEETALARDFTPTPTPGVPESSHIKRYDRRGRLAVEQVTVNDRSAQRLVADWGSLPDAHLTNCLYERAGASRFHNAVPSAYTIESERSQCFFKDIDLSSRILYRGRVESQVRTADGRRLVLGNNYRRSTSGHGFAMLGNYIHEAVSAS